MGVELAVGLGRLGTETAFEVLVRAKALEAEGREIIHLPHGCTELAFGSTFGKQAE